MSQSKTSIVAEKLVEDVTKTISQNLGKEGAQMCCDVAAIENENWSNVEKVDKIALEAENLKSDGEFLEGIYKTINESKAFIVENSKSIDLLEAMATQLDEWSSNLEVKIMKKLNISIPK